MKDEFDKLVLSKKDMELFKAGEQKATARIVGIIEKRIKVLEKYRKMADESNQKTEEGWFYERLGELNGLLNNIESKK